MIDALTIDGLFAEKSMPSMKAVPTARAAITRVHIPLLGAAAWLLLAVTAHAQTADTPAAPVVAAGALPRALSPWGMFMSADIVVKAVIVGLALASVVTWTIWLAKTIEIWRAKRKARAALGALAAAAPMGGIGPGARP